VPKYAEVNTYPGCSQTNAFHLFFLLFDFSSSTPHHHAMPCHAMFLHPIGLSWNLLWTWSKPRLNPVSMQSERESDRVKDAERKRWREMEGDGKGLSVCTSERVIN
jgi:hypothetical protein